MRTAKDQTALKVRIRDLAAARVRYGYRRLHVLLRREGGKVNHKRVYRLYRLQGLSLRLKTRNKRIRGIRVALAPPTAPNERWSMDCMRDSLHDGRRFRILPFVDTMRRERPTIAVDSACSGSAVVAVLERVTQTYGLPKAIHVDNGPAFVSTALDMWAQRNGVKLAFSRPGTPTDHPYSDAFTGRVRQACLDQNGFASLEDARQIIEAWRVEYTTERPHPALNN